MEEKKEAEIVETEAEVEEPTEEPKEEPKEDLQATILQLKNGYETKLAQQKEKYEKRIEERNKVINQLLLDGDANKPKESFVDKINKRREAQLKKW